MPIIDAKALEKQLTEPSAPILLDAREPDEYAVSHLQGARNVGFEDFDLDSLADLDRDAHIVVYCSVGYRSEKIGEKLQKAGFRNVINLWGGIFDWANQQLPLVNQAEEKVTSVHPYDKNWGKWLKVSDSDDAHSDDQNSFVEANIIGIFFHELGHALIDIEEIPIFGQEEDAADIFSIFLIEQVFENRVAEDIAFNAAVGFWAEAEHRIDEDNTIAWWDVHGPDEQRFYNTVCLFYGADPENRKDFAEDLELPEERADYCADEYDQATASWGSVLDEIADRDADNLIKMEGDAETFTYEVVQSEVYFLNEIFRLKRPLIVKVLEFNEVSAFYDPEETEIIMCTEFENHLARLYK